MKKAPLSKFKLHPSLAIVPTLPEVIATAKADKKFRREYANEISAMEENWQTIVVSVGENGVLDPVRAIVRKDFLEIVDGRHRYAASVALGKADLPYVEVDEKDVDAIIEGSASARRDWTKSQRAYWAALRHPGEMGRPGKVRTKCGLLPASEVALRFGVSVRMIELGRQVAETLAKDEAIRAKYEAKIWAGASLNGVISGIGAEGSTPPGKSREASSWNSAERSIATLRTQLSNFEEWSDGDKASFAAGFRDLVGTLPSEAIEKMRAALKKA